MIDYKDFAIDLAKKAGSVIKTNFALGMEKEWKEDETPLTLTDKAVNQMVLDAVKNTYPDHGVIAEEGSDYNGQEYAWVCDPIDGTIPFSHGMPTCAFMLALTRNGKSILGVIYDPFMDNLYFAEEGKGAYLNGKRIHVSKTETLSNACVALIIWKRNPFYRTELINEILDTGIYDFNVNSTGYMDGLVANGEFAAVLCSSIYPWDTAAPKIIIEETRHEPDPHRA